MIVLIPKSKEESRVLAADRLDELRALMPGIRYKLAQEKKAIDRALRGLDDFIPSIPTDEADEDEIIPRKPPTMAQQEEGFGYNEREFIGEDMQRKTGKPGPAKGVPLDYKKEKKQKRRGAVRVGPRVRHQAQAPVVIGAAEIVAKKRPELRGK